MKCGSPEHTAWQNAEYVRGAREQHAHTMASLRDFRANRAAYSETELLRVLNFHTRVWGFPRHAKWLRLARKVAA